MTPAIDNSPVSTTPRGKLTAGVKDTSNKSIAGAKIITGVIDTGDKNALNNLSLPLP